MTDQSRCISTRERLIAAATTLFHRAGVHATSVDEIAAAAGVTKPTLYRHFPGKEDVVVACLEAEGLARRQALALAVEAGDKPAARIRAIGRHFARDLGDAPDRGLLSLSVSVEFPQADGRVRTAIRAQAQALQDQLEALIAPGQPQAAGPVAQQLILAICGASAGVRALGPMAADSLIGCVEAIIASADLSA
jgi:AcrR family transcriptional regulator